jgi:uncharacterized protein (TIGR02594 family)
MKVKVSANKLNLRSEPKLSSKIIAILEKDQEFEFISKSGDEYWYKIQFDKNTSGWASHKFLVFIDESTDESTVKQIFNYPWLKIAFQEIGVKEYSGAADNPRVVAYLSSTSLGKNDRSNDETYWCSAFVNWCVEQAGFEGTDSAWAKSWLNWGKKLDKAKEGCIAILTRDKGGHVAFYLSEDAKNVTLLGGNQNDQVCIQKYPKSKVLGYREI